jgi:hypothetical protein
MKITRNTYDAIHSDRDCAREYTYVKSFAPFPLQDEVFSVLDLGYGTGNHLKFFHEDG